MGTPSIDFCATTPLVVARELPSVFVVDDDISVRESLEALIRNEGFNVATFLSATAFLSHPRETAPNCLVLDLAMPDFNGLELQQQLATDRPEMPIIFISGHGDVAKTVRAMKAGAVEFLTKPFNDEVLLNAVRSAIERSKILLTEQSSMNTVRSRYECLTRRERQVLELVVSGCPNKEVGNRLQISEITVKAHRGNVMRKMEADSLADLIRMASQLRVI